MKPQIRSALLIGVGAVIVWLSSRMRWVSVEAFDDKSGSTTEYLVGAVWSTEIMALALVLAAACVAALVLRRIGRRIIGIVSALVAAAASLSPLNLLIAEPDAQRAHQLLTSGMASQRANAPVTLSEWAEITAIDAFPIAAVVALVGCAVALFGGILLAMRPGLNTARGNQYQRRQARAENIRADLAEAPDSGRVLWDALDEDIDPTDPGERASNAQ